MRKNEKGFGVVEILVVIVVLGLVGAVGWLIYDRQNTETDTKQASKDQVVQDSKTTNKMPNYNLPTNWEELKCSYSDADAPDGEGEQWLIYPNDDPAKDCDDRNNLVLIDVRQGRQQCLTGEEIAEIKQMKPIESYSCESINIRETRIIKETADYGGGPSISYSFPVETNLIVTYYAQENGELTHAPTAQKLVESITF